MPWIEQDGNRIHYARLSAGGDTGVPVILHHGMAQWTKDWANAGWIDVFGDRPVYALDALGHGRSDRPGNRTAYSVEKRAEAVLKIADTESIDRFIFFGFSMGGRVGFELALCHPRRVTQLVVGGMHGLKPSIDQRNLDRRVAVLRSGKWTLVERAVGAQPGDGRNNEPEALALSTEAVLDWQGAEDRLPHLGLPVLLFCGTKDSLLEYARTTAGLISGSTFVELVDTTHAASFYSSTEARACVAEFLSA